MPHRPKRLASITLAIAFGLALLAIPTLADGPGPAEEPDRSPIALALDSGGTRLLVANQAAGSVSWVDAVDGRVLRETKTGDRPSGVAISRDGKIGVVSHWYGYDLAVLDLEADRLAVVGRVEVGPEPRGVVIAGDGRTAYVAVGASNEVVRVDLAARQVTGRVEVGREPRGLAFTPDGARLVVGNARGKSISVVDLAKFAVERTLHMQADNLRQVAVSPDGKYAYVAAMNNRGFAATRNNIDLGWVLGQRIERTMLDGSEPAECVSLDPRGEAVGDVHGLAFADGGKTLAVACGGTHELLLLRDDDKPLSWRNGVGRDFIETSLLRDKKRFRRVPLGGRPTEIVVAPEGKTLYVANYLANAIQVVDAESAQLTRTIALGGPATPSLARRGEALFHDAGRSVNNWYSCNTCHSDGHTNGLDFDTLNDGWQDLSATHLRSRKKVPTLRRVASTGPWTWHGWQDSLDDAMVESFTKSMQGKRPTKDEVEALVAFLATLEFPRNPTLGPDGGPSPAAKRGEVLFRSKKANCASCHSGPELTDGKIHDLGLNERGDVYKGHNPPSLRGVYDKDPYLHDGRARTLRDALTGEHAPEALGGEPISESELDDLIAYLKSL
jgi:YVTN family beta-propeller protein